MCATVGNVTSFASWMIPFSPNCTKKYHHFYMDSLYTVSISGISTLRAGDILFCIHNMMEMDLMLGEDRAWRQFVGILGLVCV